MLRSGGKSKRRGEEKGENEKEEIGVLSVIEYCRFPVAV
jgi:hypothetical protein